MVNLIPFGKTFQIGYWTCITLYFTVKYPKQKQYDALVWISCPPDEEDSKTISSPKPQGHGELFFVPRFLFYFTNPGSMMH
ncbi:hypothetical protein SLEP1_g11136 [Rubroshorea leprosula]|uniref:Uncharacterized protein n=1 Tax=Rubroshorea leprosula TaxID=152421 RepID=A0AAV5IAC4_9ROSI|nr:hypothetical protein SLEP1_g11136 [Rubroshorea leprosula]